MKASKETSLVQVPFGSYLYGTNGPSSDLDFKVICVPPLDTLLLNRQLVNRKEKPVGKGPSGKMAAGEAEYEYIPLQVFLDDFFNGQTYALEMAFAIRYGKFKFTEYSGVMDEISKDVELREWVNELIDGYLTNNVKKMVGYAVSQARLYGLKTERYTAMNNVVKQIENWFDPQYPESPEGAMKKSTPLSTNWLRNELLKMPHVKEVMIENAEGGSALAPAFDICGKKFPYTSKWFTILYSLLGSLEQYGERVKSFDGEGCDWKALSHAIRISEQVLELSREGTLKFPRPNAAYLRSVKEGRETLADATEYLTARFNEVDDVVAASVLQDRTPELEASFEQFKLNLLRKFYGL
jgi:hypothetical protein